MDTPHGPAEVDLTTVDGARGILVLGHGAAGGIDAPDLVAATSAAAGEGFAVARVLHPYRVAGRRTPPRPAPADAAWIAVVEHVLRDAGGVPLVVGGRSWGGRVACRTANATGAVGVVCLAFPVHPPGRPDAPNRLPELDAVDVPVLVVQGTRDPFGMPPPAPNRTIVQVEADHSLRTAVDDVAGAVGVWLRRV